jgi:hypothetical protein
MSTEAFTQELPVGVADLMLDKVAKANRKAVRNGLGEIYHAVLGEPRDRNYTDHLGFKRTERVVDLTIEGEAKGLPGWRYAAKVDWSLENPVLHGSPFYEGALPRPTEQVCDHCGTKRHRTDTHIVVGPDGAFKQVGAQCLTAYTGIPLGWVSIGGDLKADEDDFFAYSSGGEATLSSEYLLTIAVAVVDALGFTSKKQADEYGTSTLDRVCKVIFGPWSGKYRDRVYEETKFALEQRSRPDAEVEAEVAAILEWTQTLFGSDSDYLYNLAAIFAPVKSSVTGEMGQARIGRKHWGFAVSAVSAYRRDRDRTERFVAKRKEQAAERIEVVEGRRAIVGTVKSLKSYEGDYGIVVKMLVETDDHQAIFGTVASSICNVVAGQRVSFTATVTRSQGDPKFGIFKRPSKAVILEGEAA